MQDALRRSTSMIILLSVCICCLILARVQPLHPCPTTSLSRPQVLPSLRVDLSTPQSLVGANLNRPLLVRSHSVSVPFRSPFPMHVALSGTIGKNLLNPNFVWGFRTMRMLSSGRTCLRCYKTATIPHSTCDLQNSRAWLCRGNGLSGSSSVKFYVFVHDIDSVIERFSDDY